MRLIYQEIVYDLRLAGLRGATVARLTPDQKVACSNHVGVMHIFTDFLYKLLSKITYNLIEIDNDLKYILNISIMFFHGRLISRIVYIMAKYLIRNSLNLS